MKTLKNFYKQYSTQYSEHYNALGHKAYAVVWNSLGVFLAAAFSFAVVRPWAFGPWAQGPLRWRR